VTAGAKRATRPLRGWVLALVVGMVLLGACSGSVHSERSASATTTALSAAPLCNPPQLMGSATAPTPGADSVRVTLSFRNLSLIPCTLEGFPSLTMRGTNGASLPTIVQHSGPGSVVTVRPRESAAISLLWPDEPCNGEHPRAAILDVRLPRMSQPIVVRVAFANQPPEAPSFSPCHGRILEGGFTSG
jgi:Protein of unknown function (DUF4232)